MVKIKKYNRIFTIVIDSLGIGAAADAAAYGDAGTDTLGHICLLYTSPSPRDP